MKEHHTIVSVFNVAIVLLLVFNSAHSDSRRSYEEPRASSLGNWKWPLNQNNAMEETRSLTKMNTAKNGNIAFPDDHAASIQPRVGSVIPSCKGQSYCEDVPNYPTNLVKDIIARNPHLVNYTSVDMIDMLKPRLGEDSVETESFCASSEHVVLPKTAENMNNEWKYILNNEELKQGVRIEKCINEGQRCSIKYGIPMGYETTCKQKFVYNQLLGLEDDGSVAYQHFRFPSSCCCHVKFIGTSTRIGGRFSSPEDNSNNLKH
ncbi:protein spaetzle-like [Bombus affinis]|uniref:protein spaetzle-like n=1 Tax=Bombus affinis TaxID=309941 RepID=UPI0021B76508|nr:protein spaetzle-like [Bombus affinis]XP_050595575.1 protein spaetzle-like [Bombus affinis]